MRKGGELFRAEDDGLIFVRSQFYRLFEFAAGDGSGDDAFDRAGRWRYAVRRRR